MPEFFLTGLGVDDPTSWFNAEPLKASSPLPAQIHAPLRHTFALALQQQLASTRFQRHHHAAYPIDIAPLETIASGPLRAFTSWLRSEDAARLHATLGGLAAESVRCRQVQVARMVEGQRFPQHEDTDERGIAAIYYLSDALSGGALAFADGTRVSPSFNSVVLFCPRGARHAVEPVTRGVRFSVTAFFLVPAGWHVA